MIVYECDCCGNRCSGQYRDGSGLPHGWHEAPACSWNPKEKTHHFCSNECRQRWEAMRTFTPETAGAA